MNYRTNFTVSVSEVSSATACKNHVATLQWRKHQTVECQKCVSLGLKVMKNKLLDLGLKLNIVL